MPLSALYSLARTAHRVLFACTLAFGWSCIEPNPAYRGSDPDSSSVGDAMGLPDAMPEALVEPPMSIIEPPGGDALSAPPESPGDATMLTDATTGAEASPRDTQFESGADTGSEGAGDAVPAPSLTLDKLVYSPGENIVVSFFNGPGNFADWIGIYQENAAAPSDASRSLLWYYTDNKGWASRPPGVGPKNGAVTFGIGSRGSREWPLPIGRYKTIFLSSPHIQLAEPAYFQVR